MSKRWLSIGLITALLISVFSAYTAFGQAGAVPNGVTGGTAAQLTAVPTDVSHIAGLTPTQGITEKEASKGAASDWSEATNGVFPGLPNLEPSANGVGVTAMAEDGSGDAWTQITYTMANTVKVEKVAIINMVSYYNESYSSDYYLRWGRVYVSNSLKDLYTTQNLAVEYGEIAYHGLELTLTTPKEGTFIGFSFYIPQDAASGWQTEPVNGKRYPKWWQQARIGELGVYGEITGPAAVDTPIDGKAVPGGMAVDLKAEPEAANRLAGLVPTQGLTGEGAYCPDGSKSWNVAVDGSLPGISAQDTGEVSAMLANRKDNGWTQITYTLPEAVAIEKVLVASCGNDGADYWLRWGKIYIANDKAKLYSSQSLVLSYDDIAMQAMMLTLAQPVTGRYIGFSFYIPEDDTNSSWQTKPINGVRYPKWWQQARIGELGVYGADASTGQAAPSEIQVTGATMQPVWEVKSLPKTTNLLSGVIPTAGDTGKKLNDNCSVLYSGDVAALTDGQVQGINRTDDANTAENGRAVLATVQHAWNSSSNGWGEQVWLVYDLGEEKSMDTVLIANGLVGLIGGAATSERYVYQGEIYVGATRAQAVNEAYMAVAFKSQNGHASTPAVMRFDLSAAVTGRYVGVHFTLPEEAIFSETGIKDDGSGDYKDKTAYLSEIGVYYENTPYRTEYLNGTTAQNRLPAGDNLLAGLPVYDENGSPLSIGGSSEMSIQTPASLATDGIILGITQPVSDQGNVTQDNKFSYRTYVDGGIVFDLRGQVELQQFLLAADAWDDAAYWTTKAEIYTGNTLSSLFEGEPITVSFDGQIAALVSLNAKPVCRYVGFRIPAIANVVRIGELGVYGVYQSKMGDAVNLIANKMPAEEYLCEPSNPDIYNPGTESNYLAPPSWGDHASYLTDGDTYTRSAWTVVTPDRHVTTLDRQYIQADTAWSVLIYHLGGTASVESITLTSTHEWGNYYVAGLDLYVGQSLKTLFEPKNRVYTTEGEKTTINEDGETILDPSKDIKERIIRCELEKPVSGRYVAFVISRPHASTQLGYSIARIDELEVMGALNVPEVLPTTVFTHAASGCTMTVEQLNFDDVEFFSSIDHLEVTSAPWTGNPIVCGEWLKVNSDVLTFTLIGKDGKPLTEAQLNNRVIRLTVPNDQEYGQGLGEIIDGQVTRIRNSRTADGQILGNSIANYPTKIVRLTFNEQLVISNPYAGQDVFSGEAIAGAFAVRGGSSSAPAWLWVVCVFPVLLAGAILVCKKIRKGGAAK